LNFGVGKPTEFVLLLVEDNPDDVLFLRRALRKGGHSLRLEVVQNGEEAIAYLSGQGTYVDRRRHPLPTHVLLDLKLPKISGFEVLAWMRSRPEFASIPVSILSSSPQTADIDRARALGADCYLTKPISFEQLVPLVNRIVEWMETRRCA
jgi:CheY-like chemotaxis protein